MSSAAITIVINGNTYRLSASDSTSIRNMPAADRQHLLALLEEVKRQDGLSRAAVEEALHKVGVPAMPATRGTGDGVAAMPQGDLGKGDVDALMARLVMEDKNSRKPQLTRQSLYKVVGAFLVLVFFLVLVV